MLLIDDLYQNIKAAKQAGLMTILYTSNQDLFQKLEKSGFTKLKKP